MRRRDLLTGCLIGLTLAFSPFHCTKAQTWHGYTLQVDRPWKDCGLRRVSTDDFITFGANQVTAPRWQLEVFSIGFAGAASYAVHRWFPVAAVRRSAKWSSFIGGVATGLIPHLNSQIVQRRYPITVTHDAAVLAQRMVPYVLTFGDDGSFRQQAGSLALAGGIAIAASCDAQG